MLMRQNEAIPPSGHEKLGTYKQGEQITTNKTKMDVHAAWDGGLAWCTMICIPQPLAAQQLLLCFLQRLEPLHGERAWVLVSGLKALGSGRWGLGFVLWALVSRLWARAASKLGALVFQLWAHGTGL